MDNYELNCFTFQLLLMLWSNEFNTHVDCWRVALAGIPWVKPQVYPIYLIIMYC